MPKKAHFPRVNKVRWRGETYYYHRPTGIRLPDDYGSAEFARQWALAESRKASSVPLSDPRSYSGLIEAFRKSEEWRNLKDRTQYDYERIIKWMLNEGAGNRPAADLTQDRCEKIVDKAVRNLGWRQGLYVLQFNRRLYAWVLERAARKKQWGDINPWADLKPPQRPRNAAKKNRPWEPDELVEVLLDLAERPGLRRAYVLGASGFDSKTMCLRRWDEYRNGGFEIDREKTGAGSFVMVPPILRLFLEEGERPSDFIVTSFDGQPFSDENSLQTQSSKYLRAMAKDGKVGAGLTLHGLRHTVGKAIADSGGTLHAIQAALQHKSARMALYYSEQADRKRALLASAGALDNWIGLQSPPKRDSKVPDSKSRKASDDNG